MFCLLYLYIYTYTIHTVALVMKPIEIKELVEEKAQKTITGIMFMFEELLLISEPEGGDTHGVHMQSIEYRQL